MRVICYSLHACNIFFFFLLLSFTGKFDMARHSRLDEARVQQMLAEDTIDLLGDITFTEICEPATDDSHTSPPLPPYTSHDSASPPSACHPSSQDARLFGAEIMIDVEHSKLKTCVTSVKYQQEPEEEKIIECREDRNHPSLSPIARVLPPSPVAGPSGLSTSCGTAKRKLLMSTPLPTKRRRVMTQDDSDPDYIISDADSGTPIEFDTDDSPSDSDYKPPCAPDTEDEATRTAHDFSTTDNQGGDGNAIPTAVNIVQVPESERRARDKTYWSRTPLQRPTLLQPSAQYTPGLATPSARGAVTPLDFFELFFDEDMLNEIVHYTKISIEQNKKGFAKDEQTVRQTSITEMRALIGVLIQAGAKQDNKRTVQEMFSNQHGAPLYRAAMSERRFSFLLRCIRFDDTSDKEEREARKRADKFTLFRSTFEKFVENCKRHYTPGDKITVDEQLLGFRGNCPFRVYIPNKPAKYGIKIVSM